MSDSFVFKKTSVVYATAFPRAFGNYEEGPLHFPWIRWTEIWKFCSFPAISDDPLLADKRQDPPTQRSKWNLNWKDNSKASYHIRPFCHPHRWLCCVLYSTGLRLHKLIASASLSGPQPHQNIITMKPKASSYHLRIHSLSTLSWFGICMNPSPPIQTLRLSHKSSAAYKQACSCRADQPYCLPACERVV